ncbi:hypothetical protein [Alkalihalobacillus pseudalcaliphilus]|uniref:hypothetical protein n=1 Tax=Alkalihalobacillus pseudalcaliphilus TaxID=79884 RepID=UPI00069F549A|nr:hypothetical protein [Alkalihalobacillus pseudalcaliphilus]
MGVVVFFMISFIVSFNYEATSWWSIFTANQSTHTPLAEQISIVKTVIAAIPITLLAILYKTFMVPKKANQY